VNLRERLPEFAFDRPVSVLMLFVALLVVGVLAWTRIPLQMMPSGFEPGFLGVWVSYPNASPQEIDEQIVTPLQEQLATVSGISSSFSRAREGSMFLGMEFYSSVDMDEAYNEVSDRMERALLEMPDDVRIFNIWRYNPADQPIVWAGAQMPLDLDDPYHVLERVVKPRLERIDGIAGVDTWGVPQRAVYIDYDKERIYAHGVNLGPVISRLSSDNFQMAGGEIQEGGQVVTLRSLSMLDGVEDLKRFPVKEGVVLGDIADVKLRGALSLTIDRINGEESGGLALRKESGANTVQVAREVEKVFEELEADARTGGTDFFVFFSQGDLIQESVSTLTDTALTGGVFAVIILFVFLREWRMTLLIAASIPFSLLITVGLLYFQGYSLNLLSLMGLMLAVGMVVDNAIVVVETIYRYRAEGADARTSAIKGTAEVNLAIVLSTMTTMVVFLPVILMSGDARFGFFLQVLGMPVVYALAASLVVALLFAPLATRYMGEAQIRPDAPWLVSLSNRYGELLGWVTAHRVDAAMTLTAMGLLTMVVAVPGVQCSGSGEENLGEFTVRFEVPPQADPYERDDIVKVFEGLIEERKEAWGVRVYRAHLGGDDMRGWIDIYLESDGPMAREDVMEAAREMLPDDLPGVSSSVGWEGDTDGGGGQKSVPIRIFGEDLDTLAGLSEEVARRAEVVPGVVNAIRELDNEGADEVRLRVDRDSASRFGVSAQQVAQLVGFAMRGTTFQPIRDGDKELNVAARFSLEDRSDLDKLLNFDVFSPVTMGMVPLSSLTDVEFGKGAGTVRRNDRRTSTTVTVEFEEDANDREIAQGIEAALADMVLPRGYEWSTSDFSRGQEEEDSAMGLALLLSVVFVYLLIGVLFESWILPLSVVTSIPMAMMGAMWFLYVTDTPMDTMGGVGLVILVGVVVNNGIVLVDLITQLRAEGMPRDQALVEAGRRRLRPILMTALTTICGLAPMAMGSSSFIGIPYAPLGRTVIGGLLAGTLLTLLFVPYLYSLLDDLRDAAGVWLAMVRRKRTT